MDDPQTQNEQIDRFDSEPLTPKQPYAPVYDPGGLINCWRSLDKACNYLRRHTIEGGHDALSVLIATVGQQAIFIEDLQRRLTALDGRRAAMHLSDLPPSDGDHLHPEAVPVDPSNAI